MPMSSPRNVLPFPLTRRHVFIRRLAAQVLARTPALGVKHFAHQLRRQAKSLRHKGFDEAVVEQQTTNLERAVRAQMWRFMLGADAPPPGRRDNG